MLNSKEIRDFSLFYLKKGEIFEKNRLFLKKIQVFSAKHIEVKHISGIGLHDELSISGIPPKARCLTVNNDCSTCSYRSVLVVDRTTLHLTNAGEWERGRERAPNKA